jgi:hypothetical protein
VGFYSKYWSRRAEKSEPVDRKKRIASEKMKSVPEKAPRDQLTYKHPTLHDNRNVPCYK